MITQVMKNWFLLKYSLYFKQSKRNIFLSTCPSDKHYIKLGCLKSKSSCTKGFAQNLKLKNRQAFNVFNHIISLVNRL